MLTHLRTPLCLACLAVIVVIISSSARAGVTTHVSVASDGTQGNSDSGLDNASISADGRYVAFRSYASNLIPGDTNEYSDVFVHDRQTGITERVSVASDGTEGNSISGVYGSSISADGRYVVFESTASNLVPGDTNVYPWGSRVPDVFVHDRQTGVTKRVSVASDGRQSNSGSGYYCVLTSADGRYVAFESTASNLVPGDTNGEADIFVRDRDSHTTVRVSASSAGAQAYGHTFWPSISADGRYVAFSSFAPYLVPGDTNVDDHGNDVCDVFVHDRQTGVTERVSVASDGTQGNGHSEYQSISADGRYVAFESTASNLVPGDTNRRADIFIHDRDSRTTVRVSVAGDGTQGKYNSNTPTISADGRHVAFQSIAYNLVPGGANVWRHVFVRDRWNLAETKTMPEGAPVTACAYSVTAAFPGYFYMEEMDRSSAIRVSWPGSVTEGKRVRVDGSMAGASAEQTILATSVRTVDSLVLDPLAMKNDAVGGGDLGLQQGVWNWRWAPQPAGGWAYQRLESENPNNIGLLISTFGRVTQKGVDYLYVDDGSFLKDGTSTGAAENTGIRVVCDPSGYQAGDFLVVTGISSCFETDDGFLARRILTRKPEDVRKVSN